MKKETAHHRSIITNDLMHYIYEHIDSQINLDTLSRDLKISKFHMHRLFKEEFGKNIYETIQTVRLQKAADLLIANKKSTILEISALCGYSSQTSFIRAFSKQFGMSPKIWRQGGYIHYSQAIVKEIEDERESDVDYQKLSPTIKKMSPLKVYYIRHTGYDGSIKACWQKLQTLLLSNSIENSIEIALYHDNPLIVPFRSCNYVASIAVNETNRSIRLPSFEIEGGVYAEFSASGYNEDILKLIEWIHYEWLPASGYEATIKDAYIIYEENNFLNETGFFSLKYYLPILFT